MPCDVLLTSHSPVGLEQCESIWNDVVPCECQNSLTSHCMPITVNQHNGGGVELLKRIAIILKNWHHVGQKK